MLYIFKWGYREHEMFYIIFNTDTWTSSRNLSLHKYKTKKKRKTNLNILWCFKYVSGGNKSQIII